MSTETLDALVRTLWQAHLGLSLGLVAVALLRRPVRRLAGAQEAYALWLLPLLCLAGALMPDAGLPRLALDPVIWSGAVSALPSTPLATAGPSVWLLAWGLGAAGLLLVQTLRHRRFVKGLPVDAGRCLRTPRGSSPGLLGVWRPRLLLPMDFEERFSAQEQQWIRAHEALHARRQDNAVRLLAALLQAGAWFNPLLWWAVPALRHDQELACDATLLRSRPEQWRGYARALLKSDVQFAVPIAASAWQPTHPLKERIDMLKTAASLSLWRRRAGRLTVCALAVLAAGAVQALRAEQATPAAKGGGQGKAPLTASAICPTMVRPDVPVVNLLGTFKFKATYEVDAQGHPVNVRVSDGEPAFQNAIRQAISQYRCKARPGSVEVEQHFEFRID